MFRLLFGLTQSLIVRQTLFMSPLDVLKTFGNPIAYHPAIAKHTGSVTSAIFLCQLIYWDGKGKSELGTYKTADEWQSETGLSYREQATARKKLRDLGLLIETHQRLIHRIYYKLDHSVFNNFIKTIFESENDKDDNSKHQNSPNAENAIREKRQAKSPNDESAIGGRHNTQTPNDDNAIGERLLRNSSSDDNANRYIDKDYHRLHTEITTEITSKNKEKNTKKRKKIGRAKTENPQQKNQSDHILDGLDISTWPNRPCMQIWADYKKLRQSKKAPITQTVVNRMGAELHKVKEHGITVDDFLSECITRGWQGGKAEWMIKDRQNKFNTNGRFDPLSYIESFREPVKQCSFDLEVINAKPIDN